jgi:hypothetical protein
MIRRAALKSLYNLSIIWLIMILMNNSCIDEYWPVIDEKDINLLVVEGMITTAAGPYTIRLSRSASVNQSSFNPVAGCEVTIIDNLGKSEILNETSPGVYQTSVNGMQGVPGRKYKIQITAQDGKVYQSGFEELKDPIGIGTVYTELEYRPSDNFSFDIPGYQFYINTQPSLEDSSCFLWRLEQTYEYNADYLIFYSYDGQIHDFGHSTFLYTCWKTDPILKIFTASTIGQSQNGVNGFPLHYVSFDTKEFSVRYSLKVLQFTITPAVQKYWNNINELNTSGGGLFSEIPFQVNGNMTCTTDPTEKVLGYFFASGVDELRIFKNRPLLPVEMYYYICSLSGPDYEAYGDMFMVPEPESWPLYITEDEAGVRALPNQVCIDCRLSGGTTEKPNFWEDY